MNRNKHKVPPLQIHMN